MSSSSSRTKVNSMTTILTSSWMTPAWAPCSPTSPSARTLLDPTPSTASAPPLPALGVAHPMKVWITSWPWQNTKWQLGAPAWFYPWMTQWRPRPLSPCPHRPPRHALTHADTDCKKGCAIRVKFVVFNFKRTQIQSSNLISLKNSSINLLVLFGLWFKQQTVFFCFFFKVRVFKEHHLSV